MKLRPRYSLLTLFVILTAFGIWLGWEKNLVRQRSNWMQTISTRGGTVYFHNSVYPENVHLSPLPWYRRLIGDRAVVWIRLYPDCSGTDRANITSAFPEAKAITGATESPPSASHLD